VTISPPIPRLSSLQDPLDTEDRVRGVFFRLRARKIFCGPRKKIFFQHNAFIFTRHSLGIASPAFVPYLVVLTLIQISQLPPNLLSGYSLLICSAWRSSVYVKPGRKIIVVLFTSCRKWTVLLPDLCLRRCLS